MNLSELVQSNRSFRRFDQSRPVSRETLEDLVALARICPSAMNAQPLRYVVSSDPQVNARIFSTLSWAGFLPDWPGPADGEQPTGYIVVFSDKALDHNVAYDAGIACQTMLLGAAERGLGGCMLGSVRREELASIVGVVETRPILLVVAIGVPAEPVVLEDARAEDARAEDSVRYYRDADDVHHVPKRLLSDVILKAFG